jgi:Domain of unknown function (DUF1996)
VEGFGLSSVIAMRRYLAVAFLAGAAAVGAALAVGAAAAEPASDELRHSGLQVGRGYFAVACGFSHRNQDDPIVFPGRHGRSHDHTYFGNTSTGAFSTPASLRGAGRTTCALDEDTAAYWAPTLYVRGRAIEPRGAVVYYVRRTFDEVDAFPAGLKVVAGNAMARSRQSLRVTSWSCGFGGEQSSTVPACLGGRYDGLRLRVRFPDCWDGRRLDSVDHKRHMAYSSAGRCPLTHPVEVPAISLVIHYGVSGASDAELSSGGQLSGHADFVNAWDQRTLVALVDRYLNGRFGYPGPRR